MIARERYKRYENIQHVYVFGISMALFFIQTSLLFLFVRSFKYMIGLLNPDSFRHVVCILTGVVFLDLIAVFCLFAMIVKILNKFLEIKYGKRIGLYVRKAVVKKSLRSLKL